MMFVFYGPLITPENPRHAKYLAQALICVNDGVIQWIEEEVELGDLSDVLLSHGLKPDVNITKLEHGQFLMPGFIDTHTHAPQFPNLGRGGEYELLDWLDNLTFPTEAKFGNRKHARAVYTGVVNRLLNFGTTTCCYFSSAHVSGTEVLADIVSRSGQRAFIGYCNMDRNAPDFYLNGMDYSRSLEETKETIRFIRSLNNPLVQPILTPRFAISCTEKLLRGLGELASEDPARPLHIQTHISENKAEINFTAELFPNHSSYTQIYADMGLLRPTTILAHGCHLTFEELRLIKEANAGISHCPTSNFHLSSGVANVAEWLNLGIKVGLGTDVSGGFSPSMLTAIQHASIASKVVPWISNRPRLDILPPENSDSVALNGSRSFLKGGLPNATLLYLATLGGAELCNLQDKIGSLEPGKEFDALLVDLRPEMGNPKIWWDSAPSLANGGPSTVSSHGPESLGNGHAYETSSTAELEDLLEKFFCCGDDRNIAAVFVRGKAVGGRGSLGLNHKYRHDKECIINN